MNFGPGVGRTYGGHFVPPTGTNPTPSQDLYFNPALVTNPAYAQLGTGPSRIDALRGFGAAYENASVIKYFSMGANDRYRLQLRVEFYNIFNRHYLSDPVTNPEDQILVMFWEPTGTLRVRGSLAPDLPGNGLTEVPTESVRCYRRSDVAEEYPFRWAACRGAGCPVLTLTPDYLPWPSTSHFVAALSPC